MNSLKLKNLTSIKKTTIEATRYDFPRITERLDNVKISHTVADICNVVYVIRYGTLDWVKDTNNRIHFTPTEKVYIDLR